MSPLAHWRRWTRERAARRRAAQEFAQYAAIGMVVTGVEPSNILEVMQTLGHVEVVADVPRGTLVLIVEDAA